MDTTDTLANTSQEVLSQADVERLLAQVAEQQSTTEVLKAGGIKARHALEAVQPYDFRQPAFLSAAELRKLRLQQEEFTRSLAARLSIYLRLEFGLQLSRLQTVTYRKFIESLPNPTHITLFKADPLRGICVLNIPIQLGITLVDRLLGGPAHAINLDRDFTDIEAALLDQAVHIVLTEWCNQWAGLQELRPTVLGHESSGRFLQTASHDTIMVDLALEARVGDCQECLQMGFPCYTLESLVQKFSVKFEANVKEQAAATPTGLKWNPKLDHMQVPISAHWSGLELTAGQLAQLKVGDVLQMEPHFINQVQIRLANIPKFVGRLGTQENRWAVEITKLITS
jgi:flagellar motor switch protein FliM